MQGRTRMLSILSFSVREQLPDVLEFLGREKHTNARYTPNLNAARDSASLVENRYIKVAFCAVMGLEVCKLGLGRIDLADVVYSFQQRVYLIIVHVRSRDRSACRILSPQH